jgi:hypothetical protein
VFQVLHQDQVIPQVQMILYHLEDPERLVRLLILLHPVDQVLLKILDFPLVQGILRVQQVLWNQDCLVFQMDQVLQLLQVIQVFQLFLVYLKLQSLLELLVLHSVQELQLNQQVRQVLVIQEILVLLVFQQILCHPEDPGHHLILEVLVSQVSQQYRVYLMDQ